MPKHPLACALFTLCLTACASGPEPAEPLDPGPYPARWWEAVSEEGAPEWEILPQAARPPQVILSKRHELGILSNFADTPFELGGKRYASLEGFWQCMKYPAGEDDPRFGKGAVWKHTRDEVAAMVAFEAHSAGVAAEAHMKTLGIDWVSYEGERIAYKGDGIERHYELILAASWAKVRQNQRVQEVLRATGDLELLPDHHEDKDGTKSWRYYKIYMAIRTALDKKGWETASKEPKSMRTHEGPDYSPREAADVLEQIAQQAGVNAVLAPSLRRILSEAEVKSVANQPTWQRAFSQLSEVVGGTLRKTGNVYEIYP
ncbi:MAG: NADAR family protein [Planctomycetes bacterium]|nr:NADAR family protein [Planctomycetota bacterium]